MKHGFYDVDHNILAAGMEEGTEERASLKASLGVWVQGGM